MSMINSFMAVIASLVSKANNCIYFKISFVPWLFKVLFNLGLILVLLIYWLIFFSQNFLVSIDLMLTVALKFPPWVSVDIVSVHCNLHLLIVRKEPKLLRVVDKEVFSGLKFSPGNWVSPLPLLVHVYFRHASLFQHYYYFLVF